MLVLADPSGLWLYLATFFIGRAATAAGLNGFELDTDKPSALPSDSGLAEGCSGSVDDRMGIVAVVLAAGYSWPRRNLA